MFTKVLIANRGEIAVRIMRTCREMGIATVAVYSEVDAASAHVLEADEAFLIGEAEPSRSYLNMERILDTALQTGAEAVHPGYGFLAENADFAERCRAAGIVFVGPPPQVMRDLGDKVMARQIMERAGVPVIPGMKEGTDDPEYLRREADILGYPIMIKAVAGGGGKGMRIVSDQETLMQEAVSARSEAEKAFGNGSLYLEKCLVSPRHIEVQILADRHGNVLHLFERECSIQRRHQKIIEETPSPVMTPETLESICSAAISAVRAAGYVNAGTVEFLLDRDGKFYFLEVNTRLQVEHPVTEMVTGVDLVRLQLEIAAGNPLPFRQEEITRKGHSMECRIYAEDPESGFFPSPGTVLIHREPSGPGIRNDCGIYQGFEIPMEYDPILSKLIVWAEDREKARRRMIRALESYAILGVRTTIPFLIDLLRSEKFKNGDTHTGFIEESFVHWTMGTEVADLARIAYVVDELNPTGVKKGLPQSIGMPTPWDTLGEWKL